MKNKFSFIAKAYECFLKKEYEKSAFCYSLFQKKCKDISHIVEANKKIVNRLSIFHKKVKMNDTDPYIILAQATTTCPDITIIIPVFNSDKYLDQCLDSIINQTFKNIEIICIDDGSTDNSVDILMNYADSDNRITVIAQHNRYAGVARNIGIKISRGKYFLFLDSDDFFDLNFCKIMYEKALETNSDIVVCNVNLFDDKSNKITQPQWSLKLSLLPPQKYFSPVEIKKNIFTFTNNWAWNKLIKKDLVTLNNIFFQGIMHTNDTYFICMCMVLSKKISCINNRLVFYRINVNKSLTTSFSREKSKDDIFICLDEIKKGLLTRGLYRIYKDSFISLSVQHLYWNLHKLNTNEARQYFIKEILKRNFYGFDTGLKDNVFEDKEIYNKYSELIDYFSVEENIFLKIYNNIDRYKIISFDIFDTLVKRIYAKPSDVFYDLEISNNVDGFHNIRVTAEKKARESNKDREITIDDIYNYIPIDFQNLKQKEIEKEIQISFPNKNIVTIYNKLIKEGKTIVLTSDMYLNEETIKEILKKCGINGYKNIYISSSYGKMKKNGDLFKILLKEEKATPNSVLHIGDNSLSDIEVPRKLGISTIYYHNLSNNVHIDNIDDTYNMAKKNDYLMKNMISHMTNYAKNTYNYWFNIGFSLAAPLSLSFMSFLFDEIHKFRPDCILFVARDCFLLHKIYNLLESNPLPNYYIYASRGLIRNIKSGVIPIDSYKKYISNIICNNYKKIMLVDVTTINFSAQKFLSKIFYNASIHAVYWLSNKKTINLDFSSIYFRPHKIEAINFMVETLLSAPTPPVNILREGQPYFEKRTEQEFDRCKIYEQIVDGCLSFCKLMSNNSSIKNFKINISSEISSNMLFSFINNYSHEDYNMFSKLTHTADIFNKESEPVAVYFSRLKKYSISIILCVFNGEKYLKECLDSILSQSLKELEIICVDDCSTDNTFSILDEYRKNYKEIILMQNKENIGLASSRNKALKIARGEYIQFVDADDYLISNCCECIYKRCKLLKLDMLSFSGFNFNMDHKRIENSYWNFNYLPLDWNKTWFTFTDCKKFISQMHVSSCLTIYRNDFIKKYGIAFPEGLFYEDNFFFCKAIINAKRISIHKGKFYARRIHNESITQNWDKHFSDYIKVITITLEYLYKENIDDDIIEQYKHKFYETICYFYKKFPHQVNLIYDCEINKFCEKFNISTNSQIKHKCN